MLHKSQQEEQFPGKTLSIQAKRSSSLPFLRMPLFKRRPQMSYPSNLRKSLVYVLIYTLMATSLITMTTRPSDASRHGLPTPSAPTPEGSSEETAPQPK